MLSATRWMNFYLKFYCFKINQLDRNQIDRSSKPNANFINWKPLKCMHTVVDVLLYAILLIVLSFRSICFAFYGTCSFTLLFIDFWCFTFFSPSSTSTSFPWRKISIRSESINKYQRSMCKQWNARYFMAWLSTHCVHATVTVSWQLLFCLHIWICDLLLLLLPFVGCRRIGIV